MYPSGILGSACFEFLKPEPLSAEENDFILKLDHRRSIDVGLDEKLKLLRYIYKAFVKLSDNPIVSAGMATQFILESAYATAVTGAFNYSGIKEFDPAKPRKLCRTLEVNLSAHAIEVYKQRGHYFGFRDDGRGHVIHSVADFFKSYAGLEDFLSSKVRLIRDGRIYQVQHCWESTTPQEYFQRVKAAGYATDPNYAESLTDVLHFWNRYVFFHKGQSDKIIAETRNDQ